MQRGKKYKLEIFKDMYICEEFIANLKLLNT